jgi:hypothetical protein
MKRLGQVAAVLVTVLAVVVPSGGTAGATPYGWWIFTPPNGSFTGLAVSYPHPGNEQMIWTPDPQFREANLGPNGYLVGQFTPPPLQPPITLSFGQWNGRYFYRVDHSLYNQPVTIDLGPVVPGDQWFTVRWGGVTDPNWYYLTWTSGSTRIPIGGAGWAEVDTHVGDWAPVGTGFPIVPHNGDYAVVSFGFNGLWWTACGHNGPVPLFSWFRGCS